MKRKTGLVLFSLFMLVATSLWAKIDLVTLPERDSVQLTIYNSADITLVRDSRTLTLGRGINNLQFSWSNTLIDPTSLELFSTSFSEKIHIRELVFPPRVKDIGLWKVESEISGRAPVEINYFTSGISWRAHYVATLSPDEKSMDMEGYITVKNKSGEDYQDAQVRVVVGTINLLDEIAALAKRQYPFERPFHHVRPLVSEDIRLRREMMLDGKMVFSAAEMAKPSEIIKEGLSEYFLYTIDGKESIPDGWAKRLLSMSSKEIPVKNFYKYEEELYGISVKRFISFVNDKEHGLGLEPLPDGTVRVFKRTGSEGYLGYVGADNTRYIPIGEKVELNMGTARDVEVEVTMMDFKTDNYLFNNPDGNISGWDEERTYRLRVLNYRDVPVKVEIRRNFPHSYWQLTKEGEYGEYEAVDVDTVMFTLQLEPGASKVFSYTLKQYEGDRRHIK